MNAVENYYYYLCGLETIAASAMRAEGDGFGSSLESFVLKYIGNMATNAYEQVCYITGTTIDKDIAWYVPEKKAEAIRTTVGGNIQESIGGTAGELLGNTYQGVMSLGDGAISIGMDAIIGASIADVLSGVGKVSKVYKTTTAKEATEELVEATVQRTIHKNVKTNFEKERRTLTGTVWDNIKATQENYPNTNIPKSFEVEVSGQKCGFMEMLLNICMRMFMQK